MQGIDSFNYYHPSSEFDVLQVDLKETKQNKVIESLKVDLGLEDKGGDEEEDEIKEPTFIIRGNLQYFPQRSLYLFNKDNFFRIKMVELVTSKFFDNFILLCIVANSIILAMQDYNDEYNMYRIGNYLSQVTDNAFSVIFLFEAIFKIIAMGFIIDEGSYLRDAWNWLDFFVVLTSVQGWFNTQGNISALRTFRLFRPLRSLNAIPAMKKLLTTVIDSVFSLGNILVLMLFFFTILAIFSINLWIGTAHRHCRLTPVPIDGIWPVDDSIEHLCGGNQTCQGNTYCATNFITQESQMSSKIWTTDILNKMIFFDNVIMGQRKRDTQVAWQNQGMTNFDSVGDALIAIFQSTTLEGWTILMQRVSESQSQVVSTAYFIVIFFLCSFLILNLIIAVLWEKQLQNEQEEKSTDDDEDIDFLEDDEEDEDEDDAKKFDQNEGQRPSVFRRIYIWFKVNLFTCEWLDKTEINRELGESHEIGLMEGRQDNCIQLQAQNFQRQNQFENFIIFCIVANTISLATERQPNPGFIEEVILNYLNTVFTVIFALECFIKIVALGFKKQLSEYFNILDLVIVLISLIEILIVILGPGDSGTSYFTALRALRLMRVFKLVKSNESLSILIESIGRTVGNLGTFSVLLILIIQIFTLLGMQQFSGKIKLRDDGRVDLDKQGQPNVLGTSSDNNFDNFANAFVTIFQVLSGEDWQMIMQDSVRCTSFLLIAYFIMLVVVGNFVMLNLFLAILLGNFDDARASIEEERIKKKKEERKHLMGTYTAHNQDKIEEHQEQLDNNTRTKKTLFELANDDMMRKNNDMYDIIDDIPHQTTNVLNTVNDLRDLAIKDKAAKQKKHVEDISLLMQIWNKMRVSSFFIFERDNFIRKWCTQIKDNNAFNNFIMAAIIISSGLLIFQTPRLNPDSLPATILNFVDKVFTVVFVFEMVIKMISLCVIWSNDRNQGAYLTTGWNQLDFIIVIVALFDWIFASYLTNSSGLAALKALRALRALRPLRTISRAEGLKLIVDALLRAIPALGNVILVSLLFVFIFSIIGINFFKGLFYSCQFPYETDYTAFEVYTKSSCLAHGGLWLNLRNNFDNIGNALLTLFEIMTTEGWAAIMFISKNSTTLGVVTVENEKIWQAQIYFVAWIVMGNMFILNLFVGVIIDNFNMIKEELGGIKLLTGEQRTWVEIQKLFLKNTPEMLLKPPEDFLSNLLWRISKNTFFDSFITFCIILNTVVMALKMFPPDQELDYILDILNLIFAMIFNLEYIIKQIALGCEYFSDDWNTFDFIVVIGTDIGIFLSIPILAQYVTIDIGSATSVIRTFRMMRVIRLIKKARTLKLLIDTLIFILPSLTNIALLVVLGYFIFTALGINLFGKVRWTGEINSNANFQQFHISMMLLMRCSSGEAWNSVMWDQQETGNIERNIITLSSDFPAAKQVCFTQDFAQQQRMDQTSMECGNPFSIPMFLLFIIFISMMILNMFIAVVLEGFSESMKDSLRCVNTDNQEYFREKYAQFDPKKLLQISLDSAAQLLYEIPPPFGFRDMSTQKENQEERELNQLITSINKAKNLFTQRDELGFYEDTKKNILSEFSSNPRLRDFVKFKLNEIYKIDVRFETESALIEKLIEEPIVDNVIKIVNERCDLEDKNFLEFWLKNRLIKVKEKDKIKCWRQLGNIPIFYTDSKRAPQPEDYQVHIKDLLIAMSKRAIIYSNIEYEIDRIYNLEVKEYQRRLQVALSDAEREQLRKPKKPNLHQIDAIQHKITHKEKKITNPKEYYFENNNNMEIYDHYKVFHDLRENWNKIYQGTEVLEEFVREQRLKSKTVRLEWVMVNAGKIYSQKAICRYFKKFVKSNQDKGNLKGFMDENNSFKSNLKEQKKKVKLITEENQNETVKEDDLTQLIYLKTLMDKHNMSEKVEATPDQEEFTFVDWQSLSSNIVSQMFQFENKAQPDDLSDFFGRLFSNQEKQYNPYEDFYYELDGEKQQMGLFFHNQRNHENLANQINRDFEADDDHESGKNYKEFNLTQIAYGNRFECENNLNKGAFYEDLKSRDAKMNGSTDTKQQNGNGFK